MSKIARKLVLPITVSIVAITIISIAGNSFFINRYSIYKQKKELNSILNQAILFFQSDRIDRFEELEQTYNVTIVTFKDNPDEQLFNGVLREQLQARGIGFIKLWLWTDTFSQLQEHKTVTQLYNQGRLQYSIIVKYALVEDQVFAIAKNIPHTAQTLKMVTVVTVCVFTMGGLFMIILVIMAVKRVTKPMEELTALTNDLSQLKFRTLSIHTNDEMETLAHGFNHMSVSLKNAQSALEEKNHLMEQLLSNVSHEIKTPVALIKAYCRGIKDGMDDGDFLDVIIEQNNKIDEIVETLLQLSKIKNTVSQPSIFSLSDLVKETVANCKVLLKEHPLEINLDIQDNISLSADKNGISAVLINLLTNGYKYGVSYINICLMLEDKIPVFRISNGITDKIELKTDQIWQPFYVGDISRNKELSGTGLGLSIVKAVLERHCYAYDCKIEDNSIQFEIRFCPSELSK